MTEDNTAQLTAEIVSAYVARNSVTTAGLSDLIASVADSITRLSERKDAEVVPQKPAVSIKKSITPDFIVSLEDGKRYRTLKRHLTKHGMTPDEYRAKWGLPSDYPMTAPSYKERRSALAKMHGLGKKPVARAKARRGKSA